MWSILYSLLESYETNPSFTVSMLLSFCTWASGLYDAIPGYAIVDVVLGLWTVFHLFVTITFFSVADANYKKPLMTLYHRFAKLCYGVPMMVGLLNLALTTFTAKLSWQAYYNPQDAAVTLRAVIALYTWVCSIVLQKLSSTLVKMGVEHILKQEQEVEKHDIRAWKVPPYWTIHVSAPFNWIMRPEATGAQHISTDRPGLYVTNHALYALEMIPFVAIVYELKNVFLRGLGDNIIFGNLVGEFCRYYGAVNGTRENVDVLMENKDNVLVYPGGGYELCKPCAVPNYTLMWRQRLGFARVAIKHGYPIVPCATLGTEDMIVRLFDIDCGFIRKELKCPVIFIPPHRLQKLYIWFGEPIPTDHYNGDWKNDEFAKELRDKAKSAVEAGIRELRERQAKDPNRFLFCHMANATKAALVDMVEFCKDPFASIDIRATRGGENGVEPAPAYKKLK